MAPLNYLPPELKVDAKGRVTTAADIYQFGLLLNELFTGNRTQKGVISEKSQYFS